MKRRWCYPLCFAGPVRVFHDDAHTMLTVVICCIPQNPNTWMIHLDQR